VGLAQHVYECLFIFDSNSYARDPGGVSGRVPLMVKECNGETLVSRLWSEQKLAYPINGQRKGTYWLSYFRMDSEKVADFNRACQLNDSILRNLTLKVDPRLADALISHATGGTTADGDEASSEAADAEKPAEAAAATAEAEGAGDGNSGAGESAADQAAPEAKEAN
jgi:small subunit ribosomal protein S6